MKKAHILILGLSLVAAVTAQAGERIVMTGAPQIHQPQPSYAVLKANPSYRIILTSKEHRNVVMDDGQTLYGQGDSIVVDDASELGPRVKNLSDANLVKVLAINENRSKEALSNRASNGDVHGVTGKRGSTSGR